MREFMAGVGAIADGVVNWLAANARSFSYMLPDSLELLLYLSLALYFALQLQQKM